MYLINIVHKIGTNYNWVSILMQQLGTIEMKKNNQVDLFLKYLQLPNNGLN